MVRVCKAVAYQSYHARSYTRGYMYIKWPQNFFVDPGIAFNLMQIATISIFSEPNPCSYFTYFSVNNVVELREERRLDASCP